MGGKLRLVQGAALVALTAACIFSARHVSQVAGESPLVKLAPATGTPDESGEEMSEPEMAEAIMAPFVEALGAAPAADGVTPEAFEATESAWEVLDDEGRSEETGKVVSEDAASPTHVSYPNAGPQLVSPVVILLAGEKQSFWGFCVNDLAVGKLVDNVRSRQQGELVVVKSYLDMICKLAKPTDDEAVITVRSELVDGDLYVWRLASGERGIDRGVKGLQAMETGLSDGSIRIDGGPATLGEVLAVVAAGLKQERGRLSEGEAGFTRTDNLFHHARGVAIASREILKGAHSALPRAVDEARAFADLKSAIASLDEAAAMDPIVVLGPAGDRIGGNDLAAISARLGEARQILSRAVYRTGPKLRGSDANGE